MFQKNPLSSRGFTWNIKSYFLWKTMKKYLGMSSAAFVFGTLIVVVVVLMFYIHSKHLRSCRDGQLT